MIGEGKTHTSAAAISQGDKKGSYITYLSYIC